MARSTPTTRETHLVKILAVFELAVLAFFAFIIWFSAFLNGGQITIYVNTFGEKWVEFGIFLILIPIITIGLNRLLVEDLNPPQ